VIVHATYSAYVVREAHLNELMKNEIILNLAYAHEQGAERTEITTLGMAAVMRHR